MAIIEELRHKYKLDDLLTYADVARSTFYYQRKNLSDGDKHAKLKNEIMAIFGENKGRYGYRRITIELRNRGIGINHKLVLKLMRELNIKANVKRRKYHSYKGEIGKVADNIINRDFSAEQPNVKWTTDISEFSLSDGKIYLSPILDMFNGEIVSYTVGTSPNLYQVNKMLENAIKKADNPKKLVIHSDQGWQYQHKSYQAILEKYNIKQSMSRKGNCLDNSVMENFFGIMKNEMFYGHENEYKNLDELVVAINEYIDYYNNRRIKLRLGTSPVTYRKGLVNNQATVQ